MTTKNPIGYSVGSVVSLARASEDRPFKSPNIQSYDSKENIELCMNCPKPDCVGKCPYGMTPDLVTNEATILKRKKRVLEYQRENMEKYGPSQIRIRKARQARGWNSVQLGKMIGVRPETVIRWELGRAKAKWELLYPVLPELKEEEESV